MPRKSLLITLTLLLCALTVSAVARDLIPAGTLLTCTLDEPNFSPKTAMIGDPVLCHLGPLGNFGHSVFPRGAMLGGHLEDFKAPGHFVGKGSMALEFDRMILPNAEVLPLSAKIIAAPHMKVDAQGEIKGKGHPKRDAIEWMIPVLWPIKIITLPARGPYPALKGESRISLRLMEDVEVPFPTARSSIPAPPWANPTGDHASYSPSYYGRPVSASVTQPLTVTPAYYSQPVVQTPQVAVTNDRLSDRPTTVIAMKSGTAFLARDYWVQNGQLQCVSQSGEQSKFPLEQVDLFETTRVNRERNIDFVLQSRDAVEQ